jgi:hypothetical protein
MVSSVALAKEDCSNGHRGLRMAGHFHFPMFYSYILQSISNPSQLYRGHTSDLKQRLVDHNTGRCPHTAKYLPWRIKLDGSSAPLLPEVVTGPWSVVCGQGSVFGFNAGAACQAATGRERARKSPGRSTAWDARATNQSCGVRTRPRAPENACHH